MLSSWATSDWRPTIDRASAHAIFGIHDHDPWTESIWHARLSASFVFSKRIKAASPCGASQTIIKETACAIMPVVRLLKVGTGAGGIATLDQSEKALVTVHAKH